MATGRRPASFNGQPRTMNGQFARKGNLGNNRRNRVAGLGVPVNATRRISGRAIRRVRTT